MNSLWLRLTLCTAAVVAAAVIIAALIVFLGVTAYLSLQNVTTPAFATTMIAIAALSVTATVIVGVYALLNRSRTAKSSLGPSSSANTEKLMAEITEVLGVELASAVQSHPRESALVALVVGFSVGAIPSLRHTLTQFVTKHWAHIP